MEFKGYLVIEWVLFKFEKKNEGGVAYHARTSEGEKRWGLWQHGQSCCKNNPQLSTEVKMYQNNDRMECAILSAD